MLFVFIHFRVAVLTFHIVPILLFILFKFSFCYTKVYAKLNIARLDSRKHRKGTLICRLIKIKWKFLGMFLEFMYGINA
ncbi:hypothetical protein HMPREF9419_0212 [Prevotella nigrescens ATCC 33563]|nr:hypothetical protein HMPREF9419_0212 [Prevotella nigrescens ATCC 33563]